MRDTGLDHAIFRASAFIYCNRATAEGVGARQHDPHARSSQDRPRCGRLSCGNPLGFLPDPARLKSPVSYFIQIMPVRELILVSQEVTPHQSRSGEGRVICTVLNVTATTRTSVC